MAESVTCTCYLVQITALGNPKLLERVAAGLTAIRNLFSQFDEDMNNVITREEFSKVGLGAQNVHIQML